MPQYNTSLLRQVTLANMKSSKIVMKRIEDAAKKQFQEKKDNFLTQFDEHPVTVELEKASDNPMTTSSFIPKGNLFSLIGFNEGEKPAEDLREYLDQTMTLDLNDKRTRVSENLLIVEIPVKTPTLKEIDTNMAKTNTLEWAPERGWTDLIQKGITGLAQFVAVMLKSPLPSRSGGGLQHPKLSQHLSGSVGPIKYINELLQEFKSSIRNKN